MAIEDFDQVTIAAAHLRPFSKFIMSIGELPTSYLDSLSYAEQVTWFCDYLQNNVIPAINNNADALQELINYINSLDLQDEVNNKLDEMVEDGTLINLLTSYLPYVTPEMYGAKGDGETDDKNAILECLSENKIVNFSANKTYYCSTPILLENINGLLINGNNATLKFNGMSSSSVGNLGYFEFNNSTNVNIENLNINGNITWITRPYSWESGYNEYNISRNKTYDGFRLVDCSNFKINKCIATKIKVGFHLSNTTNSEIKNSSSLYTMADGILLHGGCKYVNVYNHYVNYGNDDQFSMVHESNDSNYVENCSYNNCNANNSFGACCVMQECINCYANNCSSLNNKDVPFKMGTSSGTFGCTNCSMNNIKVKSQNTIQGTSANLSTAVNNGTMAIAYTSGSVNLTNCSLNNCIFDETSGNNLSWFNPNHSGLKINNCIFNGINIIFTSISNIEFNNCKITSNDGNTITNSSVTFRNCSITDNVTYSTRGKRALSCNNCHNIILDNVTLAGKTNDITNLLSLYCDSTDYSTAYVDVNDTNLTITNMVDIYKNGVLRLNNISNFNYPRFREGQLVYFESNDGLYIITENNWTKLNA